MEIIREGKVYNPSIRAKSTPLQSSSHKYNPLDDLLFYSNTSINENEANVNNEEATALPNTENTINSSTSSALFQPQIIDSVNSFTLNSQLNMSTYFYMPKRPISSKLSDTFKRVFKSLINEKLVKYHKEYDAYLDQDGLEIEEDYVNAESTISKKPTKIVKLPANTNAKEYLQNSRKNVSVKVATNAENSASTSSLRKDSVLQPVNIPRNKSLSKVTSLENKPKKEPITVFVNKDAHKIPIYVGNRHQSFSNKTKSSCSVYSKTSVETASTIKTLTARSTKTNIISRKSFQDKPIAKSNSEASTTDELYIDLNSFSNSELLKKSYENFDSITENGSISSRLKSSRLADLAVQRPVDDDDSDSELTVEGTEKNEYRRNPSKGKVEYVSKTFKIRRYDLTDAKELEKAKNDVLKRYAFVDHPEIKLRLGSSMSSSITTRSSYTASSYRK